jgi:hypothetical protein
VVRTVVRRCSALGLRMSPARSSSRRCAHAGSVRRRGASRRGRVARAGEAVHGVDPDAALVGESARVEPVHKTEADPGPHLQCKALRVLLASATHAQPWAHSAGNCVSTSARGLETVDRGLVRLDRARRSGASSPMSEESGAVGEARDACEGRTGYPHRDGSQYALDPVRSEEVAAGNHRGRQSCVGRTDDPSIAPKTALTTARCLISTAQVAARAVSATPAVAQMPSPTLGRRDGTRGRP